MCQEPTELLWIGCLTGLILILKFKFDTLIPNINSQTFWPKVISHVTDGTIFSFVQHQPFHLYLPCKEFQLDKLHQNDGEKDAGTKGRRKKCGKIESTAMNLSSIVPTSSSSAKSPIASKSPGILIAAGKLASRTRRNSRPDDAPSSQARLQDAYLGGLMDTPTGKPVATKEESGDADLSESETGSEEDVTRKPVAYETAAGKPYASSKSDCQWGPKAERREWSYNLHVFPATLHHTEAVFSIVREICEREHDDPVDDFDVNVAVWRKFLNATLRAAVHLGQDYEANLRYVKNDLWNSVGL